MPDEVSDDIFDTVNREPDLDDSGGDHRRQTAELRREDATGSSVHTRSNSPLSYADDDEGGHNVPSQRSPDARPAEGGNETTPNLTEGRPIERQASQLDRNRIQIEDPEDDDHTGPPPNTTVLWNEHTFQDEQMARFGIVVQKDLRILTCVKCKCVVDPSAIGRHIRREIPRAKITEEYCAELRKKFNLIPKQELERPKTLQPAIPNLELRVGYWYCSECCYAVRRKHTLLTKHTTCRNSEPKQGYAQAYFGSHHQGGFFAVAVAQSQPPDRTLNLVKAFKRRFPDPLPENEPIRHPENPRDTNHFLSVRPWMEVVEGLTGKQVWEAVRGVNARMKLAISPSVGKYVDDINTELGKDDMYRQGVAIGSFNG